MGVMHVVEWARIQEGKLFKTNSKSTTKIRWNTKSHLLIRVLSVYIIFFNIHSYFMKSLCLSYSLVNDVNVMCFCKDWMRLFSYGMFKIIMFYIGVILIELSPNIIFKVFFKFHMLLPNNPTFFFLFSFCFPFE